MIYLKFDNRLQFEMVMAAYFTQDTETTVDDETGEKIVTNVGDPYLIGPWKSQDHGHKPREWELWCRGTLHAPTGEATTDEDGNTVPIMAALTGYHVDLDPKFGAHDIEGWTEAGYILEPQNPQFVK